MATRRSSFDITARVLITGEAVLILGDPYSAGNGSGVPELYVTMAISPSQ
jgi:hypothetical protein